MHRAARWLFRRLHLLLVSIFVIAFGYHWSSFDYFVNSLTPNNIYDITYDLRFEQDNDSINIETYIPQDNERQQIIEESFTNNGLGNIITEDETGRKALWTGHSVFNSLKYRALIKSQEVNYQINDDVLIPKSYPASFEPYLQETEAVQVSHPEIAAVWKSIKPHSNKKIMPVLRAIYNLTYQGITGAPFKGFTDALTTLRLKQASCNGKSRLFVALARKNNIPARLVGGIILNEGSKKTSHQWVEVYVEGHWVPFGPTNGNFAHLPANYLSLYRGDKVLFRHTSDINFDYQFVIDKRLVAPNLYQDKIKDQLDNPTGSQFNISQLLLNMGLAPMTIGLFLLFPLCTLAISFLRNVIGIRTFGVFLPMLIAAACVFTGFLRGIIAFVVILLVSFLAHLVLDKIRMLKIARLAAIITVNTLFFIVGLSIIGTQTTLEFGMLSLFPVVIISFVAERIHHMTDDNDWLGLAVVSTGTLVSIWLCYIILSSFLLEGLFSIYPEFYLLVLAGQIYIGQWTGLRFSELYRFKNILKDKNNPVLSINERNRNLVYARNDYRNLKLAADKLASKEKLKEVSVPIPETLLAINSLSELNKLEDFLPTQKSFALKPNQGSQGNGIIIIIDRQDDHFISAGGARFSFKDIRKHCIEIISGTFSQSGDDDAAYFEPLLIQHESLQKLAPYGLSDIRLIVSQGKAVSAMLRMPTKASNGKANLHQGAVGVAIDVKTGITTNAKLKQKTVSEHPDNKASLIGQKIPFWDSIVTMALKCQEAIKLGYMGVDICIDEEVGPLVLEVNGRPGIEIQNVQNRGLYADF